jgi:hypothetical protein
MNRVAPYILGFICTLGFYSCSLSKIGLPHIGRKKKTADTTNRIVIASAPLLLPAPDSLDMLPDTAGSAARLVDLVTPLWNRKRTFSTFSGKGKIHYEGGGEDQDFSANIRIRKDSVIWVDITALGVIHAARVYITVDSCFMINYLQKTAIKMPLADVVKILPTKVDFTSLQNLITGEPLRTGNIQSVTDITGSWMLFIDDGSYLQQVNYSKIDSTILTNVVAGKTSENLQAVINFLKYITVSDLPFSMYRNVSIRDNAEKYLLDIDFLSVEFNVPIETPFSIPKNYTIK